MWLGSIAVWYIHINCVKTNCTRFYSILNIAVNTVWLSLLSLNPADGCPMCILEETIVMIGGKIKKKHGMAD